MKVSFTKKDFAEQTNDIIFVKYIDLLVQPEIELTKIENKFSLKRRWNTKRKGLKTELEKVKVSEKFSLDKKDFYIQKKYLKDYDRKKIDLINSTLDENLMEFLNYEFQYKTE